MVPEKGSLGSAAVGSGSAKDYSDYGDDGDDDGDDGGDDDYDYPGFV